MDANAEVEFVATGMDGMMFGISPERTLYMNASTSLATTKRKIRSLVVKLVFNCSSP